MNPSLWRVSQLNAKSGLFKVMDGVYQIRGFDLSNMTIIEGKEGLIIIDPLISEETAKAGLDLYYQEVEQPEAGKRLKPTTPYAQNSQCSGHGFLNIRMQLAQKNTPLRALKRLLLLFRDIRQQV